MFPARFQKTRPFLINASGFTLGQLVASLCIITFVAFFLGSCIFVFSSEGHQKSPLVSCISNQKQIGLGFLMYLQDYDEKFPPCAQATKHKDVLSGWAVTHNQTGDQATVAEAFGKTPDEKWFNESPLYQYTKNNQIFRCPSVPEASGPVSYMYNDLTAEVKQQDFAAPDKTVLLCDGEDFAGNVGHAYDPSLTPAPPYFFSDGAVAVGATLQTAPTRHNGGANYGFVDGHVKWSKPEGIYFPLRTSNSRSHIDKHSGDTIGPDPAKLAALGYTGTFHVK